MIFFFFFFSQWQTRPKNCMERVWNEVVFEYPFSYNLYAYTFCLGTSIILYIHAKEEEEDTFILVSSLLPLCLFHETFLITFQSSMSWYHLFFFYFYIQYFSLANNKINFFTFIYNSIINFHVFCFVFFIIPNKIILY